MKEIGNPFQEETAHLVTLDLTIIATSGAGEIVTSQYQIGESRFKAHGKFISGLDKCDEGSFMILSRSLSISFNICQNKLPVTSSKMF